MNAKKTYKAVMTGKSDYNINFNDLCNLISALDFKVKGQNGSHLMYSNTAINERMNIQKDGSKAKGYQVKQLREIIKKHNLEV